MVFVPALNPACSSAIISSAWGLAFSIERTFQREGSLYIACNDRNAFFTSDAVRNYNLWSCQKVCEALTFLLDNIYIRFGSKL